MDQPTLDGVNTYFVSRAARGGRPQGGALGRRRRRALRRLPELPRDPAPRPRGAASCRGRSGAAARVAAAPLLRHRASPKAAGLAEYGGSWGGAYLLRRALFMPYELDAVLGRDLARAGLDALGLTARLDAAAAGQASGHARVAAMESTQYLRNQLLRDTDWASMAHSLEVRTPLVDAALLHALAPDAACRPDRVSKARLAASPPPRAAGRGPEPAQDGLHGPGPRLARRGGRARRPSAASAAGPATSTPRSRHDRDARSAETLHLRATTASRVPASTDVTPGAGRRGALRVLYLCTDAYGGYGGIAQYNRDLLAAFSASDAVRETAVVPRVVVGADRGAPAARPLRRAERRQHGPLRPPRARPDPDAARRRRVRAPQPAARRRRRLEAARGARLVLGIYGIDAWTRPARRGLDWMLRQVDAVYSISDFTLERFRAWAPVADTPAFLLPNAIAPRRLRGRGDPRLPRGALRARREAGPDDDRPHGRPRALQGLRPDPRRPRAPRAPSTRTSPTSSSARATTSRASRRSPARSASATACRSRASSTRPRRRTTSASPTPTSCRATARASASSSSRRSPAASPCVGSDSDGGREALRLGALGQLVRPDDPAGLDAAILQALATPKGIPDGLAHFAVPRFAARADAMLQQVTA